MSSLAECMNLGHQHPAVVKAIRAQAEKLCFVTAAWGAEPRAALARALLDDPVRWSAASEGLRAINARDFTVAAFDGALAGLLDALGL